MRWCAPCRSAITFSTASGGARPEKDSARFVKKTVKEVDHLVSLDDFHSPIGFQIAGAQLGRLPVGAPALRIIAIGVEVGFEELDHALGRRTVVIKSPIGIE